MALSANIIVKNASVNKFIAYCSVAICSLHKNANETNKKRAQKYVKKRRQLHLNEKKSATKHKFTVDKLKKKKKLHWKQPCHSGRFPCITFTFHGKNVVFFVVILKLLCCDLRLCLLIIPSTRWWPFSTNDNEEHSFFENH